MAGEFSKKRWQSVTQDNVPPSAGVLDSPTRCLELNVDWAGFVAGAIERLAFHDVWTGNDNTVRTAIDKIEQILLQLGSDCPEGNGVGDYTLQTDITLGTDSASYTLSNLDLLTGRDLLIEIIPAGTTGSRRNLRANINGLDTDIYRQRDLKTNTSTVITSDTRTFLELNQLLPQTATPQLEYGYARFNIPDWKNSARYPIMQIDASGDLHVFTGMARVEETDSVSSMKFWANSGNLKAGTKIAVYTRG